jgi:pyruvate formate lyase activating enzyme
MAAWCSPPMAATPAWSLTRSRRSPSITSSPDRVSLLEEHASPEVVALKAAIQGCRSVAFTYNEPVIFAEYAIACAQEAHRLGLKTVAVTSGYIGAVARAAFYRHIDAANVDLKAFSDFFYRRLCAGALEPVLQTLRWLAKETHVWLEITNLLIPSHNDGDDQIDRLIDWVLANLGPDVPLHFTAFHPDFRMRQVSATPPATLSHARLRALAAGVNHVYTGNIPDEDGGTTYCASCGSALIKRRGFRLVGQQPMQHGACQACGAPLPGRFS